MHKLAIKIYADTVAPNLDEFIPILHRWIQNQSIPNHQLIDVADYQHVPNGPGLILIAHEANFSLDSSDGRFGLLYTRKTAAPGTLADRLSAAYASALKACRLLEEAFDGKLRFHVAESVLRFNDRLLAPNTDASRAALSPEVQNLAARLYGQAKTTIEQARNDSRELLEFRLKSTAAPRLEELLTH